MATHFRLRLYLLALLIIAAFGVLVMRLWEIQITEHESYLAKLPSSSQVTVRVPGIRGEIKDRNGVTLVENNASFEVSFDLKAIYEAYKNDRAEHNKKVEEAGVGEKWAAIPPYEYRVYVGGQPITRPETDIVKVVEKIVFPELADLGLLENFDSKAMRIHYRSTQGLVPYTYRSDLSFEEFARFAEHNVDLPGVTVTSKPTRHYVYDSLASHILGYVRPPDVQTVPEEKRREFNHYVGDDYGVHGIEKTMDHHLQGKAGKRVLMRDEKGRLMAGDVSYEAPQPGADVYLTIDARIQMITERALRAIGRGAAVVSDPRTGDILAIASVPSFNPNKFIPSIDADDYRRYIEDESSPMFNRAINPYNPGSTTKIPTALAGCLDGTQNRRFNCSGGVQYGNHYMKCWIASKGYGHGSIDCSTAIKYSCNAFFYQYSNVTGIRNLETMFGLLGLGRTTGIEITAESGGTVPGPEWMRMQGGNWSSAYTAMTSIGQGFMESTPVQMSSVTGTVANGGLVYQPRLVHRILEKNGTVVQKDPPRVKHDLTKEGITAEDVEMVKKGMWRVTNEAGGTAGRAASDLTTLSGKTGTTQTGNPKEPNNAWFIAFAPYEEPEYAVAIFVQNGKSGGSAASPIAKKIIEEATAMQKGKDVELTALDEAIGNFERIEAVTYDDEGGALAQYASDEADTAVDVSAIVPTKLKKKTVRAVPKPTAPSIKQKADAAGSVADQNQKKKSRWRNVRPLSKIFGFGNDENE